MLLLSSLLLPPMLLLLPVKLLPREWVCVCAWAACVRARCTVGMLGMKSNGRARLVSPFCYVWCAARVDNSYNAGSGNLEFFVAMIPYLQGITLPVIFLNLALPFRLLVVACVAPAVGLFLQVYVDNEVRRRQCFEVAKPLIPIRTPVFSPHASKLHYAAAARPLSAFLLLSLADPAQFDRCAAHRPLQLQAGLCVLMPCLPSRCRSSRAASHRRVSSLLVCLQHSP